ncbi:multidrug effflux MFS transporter [Savagea sp. SN6]|uniref:Bcr/CflA family efflux transporter n=1 Tax=Savagea serpentis TaxID=2785297 RepID=A0A8J7GLF4_9BACL|nr:multidrug effflux MFS transporter [Savagea serpentis]MBF4501068.1 multidrug effflux MFS transporter [Savagea serpentis]
MEKIYKPEEKNTMMRVWLILILGSLTAFGPLSMDMYLPALPEIRSALGTSTSLVQMSLTACLLGLGLGQIVFGPYSDVHGRRKPLLFTLIGYALASFLSAFSPNIYVFIILRFIQGFTGAAGIVIARASARDMYSGKELTKFVALLSLVNGAAPILAPIFGGFILQFIPWQGIFHVLGLIGLLMLVGVFFGLPETLHHEKRSTGGIFGVVKTFGKLMRDRTFLSISLTQGFIMTAMFAYIAGSPFVLQKIYGVTELQFSLFFALNGVGIILAAQVAGYLSSRMAESKILQLSLYVAFIGALLLSYTVWTEGSLALLALSLFLIISCVGSVSTTGFSIAMNLQERDVGSASAFLGLLPHIGGAIVSPLVGIMGEMSAIPMAIIMLACTVFALITFYMAGIRKLVL